MSRNYTEEDFAVAVDYEGGVWEAIYGYGMREADLAPDVDPEFRAAVRAAETAILEAGPAVEALHRKLASYV